MLFEPRHGSLDYRYSLFLGGNAYSEFTCFAVGSGHFLHGIVHGLAKTFNFVLQESNVVVQRFFVRQPLSSFLGQNPACLDPLLQS